MSNRKNGYEETRKVLLMVKKAIDEGKLTPPGNYPSKESEQFVETLRSKIEAVLKIPKRRCDDYDDWKEAYGEFVRSEEFEDAGDEEIFQWVLEECNIDEATA